MKLHLGRRTNNEDQGGSLMTDENMLKTIFLKEFFSSCSLMIMFCLVMLFITFTCDSWIIGPYFLRTHYIPEVVGLYFAGATLKTLSKLQFLFPDEWVKIGKWFKVGIISFFVIVFAPSYYSTISSTYLLTPINLASLSHLILFNLSTLLGYLKPIGGTKQAAAKPTFRSRMWN